MTAISRRVFVAGAVALSAAPLAAEAQQVSRIVKLGCYSPAAQHNEVDGAFEHALQQHGWIVGQNLMIDYQYAPDSRILASMSPT